MKMDINSEQPFIISSNEESELEITKRKLEDNNTEPSKKIKTEDSHNKTYKQAISTQTVEKYEESTASQKLTPSGSKVNDRISEQKLKATVPQSPKKRLEVTNQNVTKQKFKDKFIYGNYSQYYGYRNKDKDFHDIRLDVFEEQGELFKGKHILDIGCNSGFITMEVAKRFEIKSIVGLDIDKGLINQAIKSITKHKKSLPMDNELRKQQKFPFNCSFVHGNYILKDDVLLEIETPQFDVILCLSITKWLQLNFGDKGLKQAFRRIFLQLKPKGRLILEAQPYDNYGRRKKMTENIFKNFKDMKFFPRDFTSFLLSAEVGFSKMELMGVPDHCKKGFKRPIHIFVK